MRYKLTIWEAAAFGLITLFLSIKAYPSQQQKQQLGLRLNPPVESPSGVSFVWTGGSAGQTYRIMRRIPNTMEWQPVAISLPPSGMTTVPGFTIDRDYEYRLQPDPEPEP